MGYIETLFGEYEERVKKNNDERVSKEEYWLDVFIVYLFTMATLITPSDLFSKML